LIAREFDRMEAQKEMTLVDALTLTVHSLLSKDASRNLNDLQKSIKDRILARKPQSLGDPGSLGKAEKLFSMAGMKVEEF